MEQERKTPGVSRTRRSVVRDIAGLAFWLVLTFSVAAWAARFTPGDWYQALAKPAWTPPGWIFGPVWTFLYASMAVAAWLIWRLPVVRLFSPALILYVIQLMLNGLWSWLFFGNQLIGYALVDIIALWLAIVATMIVFWKTSGLAGALFVPYALWVTFATALNWRIWTMN
jgi:benzodiazapine receptor